MNRFPGKEKEVSFGPTFMKKKKICQKGHFWTRLTLIYLDFGSMRIFYKGKYVIASSPLTFYEKLENLIDGFAIFSSIYLISLNFT